MSRRGSSKAGNFWWGYCPICVGKKIDMAVNSAALWECPECHAQVKKMRAGNFILLPDKGDGDFVLRKKNMIIARGTEEIGRIIVDLRYLIKNP